MSLDMRAFELKLLKDHACAQTHSKAIEFLLAISVEPMDIANALAAAVLRNNDEIDAYDEWERQQ